MPRATEVRYLNALNQGNITPQAEADLAAKLGKGQKKSRARDITDITEEEYFQIIAMIQSVSPLVAAEVKSAITDYTQDSTEINKYLRGLPGAQDKSATVTKVENMFAMYQALGFTGDTRITYRLATYKTGQVIPYGAAAPGGGGPATYAPINVGDTVTDAAYVSASENRQLLISGIKNPPPGTRYVKFVIVGAGGINISGGSLYSNANELAFHNMAPQGETYFQKLKRKLSTPAAGQAEILYPKGLAYQVDLIQPEGNDVHVKLSIPQPQPGGPHKNMFSGL
jgi:insecticidal toxin complex protein TccC